MSWASILIQFLNGLAGASSLFLVAAGLSLIFGVSRIVNFAHGSLYMLGMYVAVSLSDRVGFWAAVPLAALAVGVLGVAVELLVLRRVYRAPELLQLLATFALVLIVQDAALWLWGPEDRLGPRAPGLEGAIPIAGASFPQYDVLLIFAGPLLLLCLELLLKRTRWGVLLRAATEDREMAAALGINQRLLFTSVFALGALLAGLGGALQIPREPATLSADMQVIADAFVVVVVGGLGSIPGAFVAALLIAETKAFCVGLGLNEATLALEFLVMAVVLVARPWGLFGSAPAAAQVPSQAPAPLAPPGRALLVAGAALLAALALVPAAFSGYTLVLLNDVLVFALFAGSLHFILGTAGLYSFGHAAYFGLGAYAAGILMLRAGLPMEAALAAAPLAAGAAAALFGWFCVRRSGVYAAMLTLAFAQIAWSLVWQWDALTGGSNGLIGLWPAPWLASKPAYYLLTLLLCALVLLALWRTVFSPFGYALRAARDAPRRAAATGIDMRRLQWAAFALAGLAAGVAGALFAFSKGSISPDALSIQRSVDGLAMVLLGGLHTLTGAVWGAALFTWLQDWAARSFDYWRAAMGLALLALVLALPGGLGSLVRVRPR
ncbi:MAG TPA: ABC transporter permease [Burkholderiales bacterium]|nr:ABC transporter permease [Burkholderiales bacterium]